MSLIFFVSVKSAITYVYFFTGDYEQAASFLKKLKKL